MAERAGRSVCRSVRIAIPTHSCGALGRLYRTVPLSLWPGSDAVEPTDTSAVAIRNELTGGVVDTPRSVVYVLSSSGGRTPGRRRVASSIAMLLERGIHPPRHT